MSNVITLNPQEIISVTDNELTTTSLQVAEVFKKQHAHVLRKIDELATQIPDNFYKSNFGLLEIEQKSNLKNGTYKTRAFSLTKDGFMLLVMGFTGKLANQIKIAYIEAFNFMAEQLYNSQPKLDDLSTVKTRVPLTNAINKLVAVKKIPYNTAWKMVHQWCGVDKAKQMTEAQVEKGLRYVHELTISNVLVGELLPREETPKLPSGHINISFNMNKDADYTVQVRRGKVRKAKLIYCTDPQDEKQDWWLKI
ncbi:MAG: Rha family transcriptional regulator [Gammaproteobacteria bacterium]|nr:Rha family transcriptional regulator [Gammaproteobacteria bacterium]